MSNPVTIDCQYILPRFACAYLVVENGRAVFVENNTSHAVPRLMEALAAAQVPPENVDLAIITHVHLDHAGGSSALLARCPNATLLAHPRAAPHVIDPSRLVGSARKVYGDAQFEKLYGTLSPVPETRVRAMLDGETLSWQGRTFTFLHTRGHANHHFCIQDDRGSIFTGDAFGLCYPVLQDRGLFLFPSTSPTDFDAGEARRSVQRIRDSGARTAWLTHFGGVTDLRGAADQLLAHLDFAERLQEDAVRSAEPDAALDAWCSARLRAHFDRTLSERGIVPDATTAEVLGLDVDLNGQGIAHAARKRRAGK